MAFTQPIDSVQGQILELFALDPSCIDSISTRREGMEYFVMVRLIPEFPPCPRCNCEHPKIANYIQKSIKHSIFQGINCTLLYQARRYKCPVCGRTYYEKNPFVFKNQKISIHTVLDVLNDLRSSSATFSSVARKHGLSPTTVQNIFDQHVSFPRPTRLPEVLQIDETYSFRSPDSKYVCMILDYNRMCPLDLLPNRKKSFLISYFRQFSKEERNKVRYISTDMYETYRGVIRACFPKAVHGVDRFHVMQEFQRKVTQVRIRIMKGHRSGSPEYYLLKHQHELLNIRPGAKRKVNGKLERILDPTAQKKYNAYFKKQMNKYELLDQLLQIHPDLETAYSMKNELSDFFRLTEKKEAETRLRNILLELDKTGIPEMKEAAATLLNWFQEILNSFSVVKVEYEVNYKDGKVTRKDRRLTSSMIENRNKIIKAIKHNANGYTQWERFRNRCMYVLTPDAPIKLEPMETDKGSKLK